LESYSEQSIVVLSGLEAVRRRPGMYIGGTGSAGLHHMLWEIVGNSVDEHLRGHASYVRVEIEGDAISVEDDGRGIPVDPHPQDPARSVLEVVLTTLHASADFRADHVHVSPGLVGVGAPVVNALSERLDAEVWRDGRHHQQSYARGIPLGPVRELGRATRTGIRITFRPDFTILGYPVGSLLSLPLVERVERKVLLVVSGLGMAVFGLLFGLSDAPAAIVIFGFLYTVISNVFSNSFHIYQAEIFPTRLRATASGSTYALSRLSNALLPFILLPVLAAFGPVAMFAVVSAAMVVVALDIGILGPRSTGRDLEAVNSG